MPPRPLRTTIAPPPPPPIQLGTDGTPVVPPPVVPDVISRLAPDQNTVSNTGETTVIDVQADYRYPIASWNYSVSHSVQNSAYNSHPLASPASLLAYTVMMFTGLFFHIDAYLRFVPSTFADAILNSDPQLSLFKLMLDLVVPPLASYDFEAYMVHQDPLAENLTFFGTLAGSTLGHDFGRIIPSSMFIRLHNLLTELPPNSGTNGLIYVFLTSVIATMRLGTTDFNITPAHLTGNLFESPTGTFNTYRNWFYQSMDRLIHMNASRVVNATATVTRIHVDQPARTSLTNYNPYLFATSYTDNNRYGLFELLRNMNDFVKATWPNAKPLRAYTQLGSQPEPARHLSFDSVLQTWHTLGVPTATTTPTDAQKTLVSTVTPSVPHSDFATATNFLIARPTPADTNTPPAINVAVFPPSTAQATANTASVQLATTSTTDPAPHGTAVRMFNALRDVQANMIIFDPSSSSKSHLAAVITSGKVIEVNDISAIGIPTPHAQSSIGEQNSQFVLGAIQARYVKTAESQLPKVVRRRNWASRLRLPQIFTQGIPQSVLLPVFATGLVQPLLTTPQQASPPLGHLLPGASIMGQATHVADGINKFAVAIGSSLANVPDGHFVMWTSYRYFDPVSQTWYFLPTLRHIYGVRARLFGSEHISLRLH